MTDGQKLVSMSFNPSEDPKVKRAKELCAELADLVDSDYREARVKTKLEGELHSHVMHDILVAQMMAVKMLTQKFATEK